MKARENVEILVVGAGIAGIATAYYLCTRYKKASVLLVDSRQPMSFTSAQSGDNYRNWWPHPTMTDFTNYSIDLMEQIASTSSNILAMTRRGYVAATRRQLKLISDSLSVSKARAASRKLRLMLSEDEETAWLTEWLPGGAHCRPEGGDRGSWVKLGWPLIGSLGIDGAFIAGALSGFGSMSACAAGAICAASICDGDLPSYASQLSLARYSDKELMTELTNAPSKGVL